MNTQYVLVLALAVFGAQAAPLVGNAGLGGVYGPTVSETVVTPYHRTDAVSTPCQSVVRTTAVPVAPYHSGFLGAGVGGYHGGLMYPAAVGSGVVGTGAGLYSGGVVGGIIGTGVYPGVVGGVVGAGIGGFHGGYGAGVVV